MNDFAVKVFSILFSLLGIQNVPSDISRWHIEKGWHKENENYRIIFSAKASELECPNGKSINFSRIIHGSHKIYIDNTLINDFGDSSGNTTRSYYGSPIIECTLLNQTSASVVKWEVVSPTYFYARIQNWPWIIDRVNSIHLDESLNIGAAFALLFLSLYMIIATSRSVLKRKGLLLSGFAISVGTFFLFSIIGLIGISIPYFIAHKSIIYTLGFSTIFFALYLFEDNLISKTIKNICIFLPFPLFILGAFAETGDQNQLYISTIFLPIQLMLIFATIKQLNVLLTSWSKTGINKLLGLIFFSLSVTVDIYSTIYASSNNMTLGIGIVGAVFFFSYAFQKEVDVIFSERDYLRLNLQVEVDRKTKQLTDALYNLKQVQADLVHSAKMASLGTLAAGLAHEINNSINYVNGAMTPLERIIEKNKSHFQADQEKTEKLLKVMKDGLAFTVDIVKSLRNYSGINQAKFNDVNISEIVKSVLLILKNKVQKNIIIKENIDKNLTVFGSVVGLNQILMNLITNAIDAMPEGGNLIIEAYKKDDCVEINVIDSGIGISTENLDRIYDPFFTTKDVGHGSGLGLHIVLNEVKKHSGILDVKSVLGKGTTFTVKLPIKVVKENDAA